jgi:membrane-anchored protein YejM (alkaline phosphatase superfamily)
MTQFAITARNDFMNRRRWLCNWLANFSLGNALFFFVIGYHYLVITLSSKTLYGTTFITYTNSLGKGLVLFFSLVTYLGHFALIAFLPLYLIGLPLILVYPNRRLIMPVMVLIGMISAGFLVIDSIVFSMFHFHLNVSLIKISLAGKFGFFDFFGFSHTEMWMIVATLVAILVIQIGIAFIATKRANSQKKMSKKLYYVLATCLGASYVLFILSIESQNNVLAQQTPNFPLYNTVLAAILPIHNSSALIERYSETRFSQPLFPVTDVHYPLKPLQCAAEHPFNIVIIGIDAWRFDAMNSELTPNTAKFAKESWQFTHHFSGGNSTQAGLFSLFYSLPGSYWTAMLTHAKGPVLIHELLKKHYETKIFYSSNINVPPVQKTLFAELNDVRNTPSPGATNKDRDEYITNAFVNFLQRRDTQKPFFTFLFYGSAHDYCQEANVKTIYPIRDATCTRFMMNKDDQLDSINHYKNSVHFIDTQIQTVLAQLKAQKRLDDTIVIVTGDHGEEFDDNHQQFWGHGSNYTHYQVQTPFIVSWPGAKPQVFSHVTSHYDVVPTLLQDALKCSNSISDYSIGLGLLDKKDRPYLVVGSYINMGILEKTDSITLLTSGSIRVADNQANYLLDAKPNLTVIADALDLMQKYYRR